MVITGGLDRDPSASVCRILRFGRFDGLLAATISRRAATAKGGRAIANALQFFLLLVFVLFIPISSAPSAERSPARGTGAIEEVGP